MSKTGDFVAQLICALSISDLTYSLPQKAVEKDIVGDRILVFKVLPTPVSSLAFLVVTL